jgi:hypothetical protein
MTQSNHPLAIPFPVREGFLGQIVVPRNITKQEAARLCAFVQTLAVEEATPLPVIDPSLLEVGK